jgi:hypothetical protein
MQPWVRMHGRASLARFLDAGRGARMQWHVRPRPSLTLVFSLAVCSGWSAACAFPVFEFEEHGSTPRHLSYVSNQPARSEPANSLPVPQLRAARPSVVAPIVPAPEVQPPQHPAACHHALQQEGVRFETLPVAAAPGVKMPIRLLGPVHGVTFEQLEHDATFAILDCRLGLALAAWSRDLRHARVRRVDYYSMYRPGARVGGHGPVSGHAHALAIDAARFTLDNGVSLGVLDDWEGRTRGQAPCPVRRDESAGSRLLRSVTCAGVDSQLFQIVLTPHYNKAHDNHVHLERKPEVDWTYVR